MRRGCSLSSLCASGCPAARGATTGQTRDFVHNHCPVPPSRWPWRALVKTESARRTQSGLKAMLFMYGGYGLLSGITARNIPCWARGILFLEPARAFLKRRRSTRSLPDAARRRTGGAPKRSSPRRSARPSASTNGTPSRRRSRRTRCTSRRSPRSVPAHACCEAAGGWGSELQTFQLLCTARASHPHSDRVRRDLDAGQRLRRSESRDGLDDHGCGDGKLGESGTHRTTTSARDPPGDDTTRAQRRD